MSGEHSFHTTSPLQVDTTSRMPQYNTANESASQRGQAASEPNISNTPRPATANASPPAAIILASSTETRTDDTLEASSWVDVTSEAAARPAPSASASDAKSVPTSTVFVGRSSSNGTTTGLRLTPGNLAIHDIINRRALPGNDRIFLLSYQQATISSSIAMDMEYRSIRRASERSPTDLGDTFVPVPEDPQLTQIMGIGHWADPPCPPSAAAPWAQL